MWATLFKVAVDALIRKSGNRTHVEPCNGGWVTYAFLILFQLYSFVAVCQNIEWATTTGGIGHDYTNDITISSQNEVFVSGGFDDELEFNGYNTVSYGSADILILKYDSLGNPLWSVTAGSEEEDAANAICSDDSGYVYVTGYFKNSIIFGNYDIQSNGRQDIFLVKLSSEGEVIWAKGFGGTSNDVPSDITIDDDYNVIITGGFQETAYFENISLMTSGAVDVFIVKITSSGDVIWARNAGGADVDIGQAIDVLSNHTIVVSGYVKGSSDFGSIHLQGIEGENAVFVASYDQDGNAIWANLEQGTANNSAMAMLVDELGSVYVTGQFNDTIYFDTSTLISNGYQDVFTVKYDNLGNEVWVKQVGGSSLDIPLDIGLTPANSVIIYGYFRDAFNLSGVDYQSAGGTDWFLLEYDSDGIPVTVVTEGGADSESPWGMDISPDGDIYVTGYFSSTTVIGPHEFVSAGNVDVFVAKYGSIWKPSSIPEVSTFSLIHPNPATSHITISKEHGALSQLKLFDMSGKEIGILSVSVATDKEMTFDVSGLRVGLYHGRVYIGEDMRSFMFVKH